MTRRVPKILRKTATRREREWTGELSNYPVAFAVARHHREAKESIAIPRADLQRILELATHLDLRCLPMIALHGVTRLDNATAQRLPRELKLVSHATNEENLVQAALALERILESVAHDPELSLWVAAGL